MFFNIMTLASRDILVSVMNFGISSILARALDKEVLGVWFALQTLYIIGDAFFRYRSDTVMVLRYKSGENPTALGAQFFIAAVTSLIVLLVALTCYELIFEKIRHLIPLTNPWSIKVVLISLSFSVLATTYIYYLTAKKKFQRYNFLLISQTLVNFFVVGGTIFLGVKTVMSPILGQLAAWVIILPMAVKTLLSVRQDASWQEIKMLGKEGMHFHLNSIIGIIQVQVPRLFTLFFLTVEDLAEIGLLFVLVSLMLKYPAAIKTVLFTETKSGLNLKAYRPTLVKLGLVTLLLYFLVALFAPTIISIAFGHSYNDLGYTFRSILFFILLHSLAVVVIGLRNIVGDYRSMNTCIGLGLLAQCFYLLISDNSFDSVVVSYAVFSVGFFCLTCFLARRTLREIFI